MSITTKRTVRRPGLGFSLCVVLALAVPVSATYGASTLGHLKVINPL